ncbi:MAG TPA: TolC family protein [Skermanella sp.]|nr:TolC family protein [Skermanella sp.]
MRLGTAIRGLLAGLALAAMALPAVQAQTTTQITPQTSAQARTRSGPPPATAAADALEVPPGMFTLDARRVADERTGNAVVAATREALAQTGVLFAPLEIRELSLRDAALAALQRNLDIKRSGLNKSVVQQALVEAEAVFDPVFTVSTGASLSRSFTRGERPMQWKPATQEYSRGQQIKTSESLDNIFLCGDMIDILDQPEDMQVRFLTGRLITPDANGECHVRVLPATAPVALVSFDKQRVAGYYPVYKEASTKSPTGQDESYTGGGGVSQRLPWGGSIDVSIVATYHDTYYTNNPNDPLTKSYGSYKRPWTSRASFGTGHALPYSKNFGDGDDSRLAIDVARINLDVADFTVRGIVNRTLQTVDGLYWSLVGAVHRLNAAAGAAALAEETSRRMQKKMELGLATESNRAQVAAQLARLRATQQQLFGDYVTASESLREALNEQDEILFLPVGYSAALDNPPEAPAGPANVLDSPDYMRAETAVRIAMRVRDTRVAQTRPDLSISSGMQVGQSNAVFGYSTATESMKNLISYDTASASIGILYRRPLLNRAVGAALTIAESDIKRQTLLLNQVETQIRGEYDAARIQMVSARQRIEDSRKRLDIVRNLYERAVRLEAGGVVTAYETIGRLGTLLDAQLSHAQARIDVLTAETRLLAAVGALADRYGERVAQTADDRQRIALLKKTGGMVTFGGPL